MWLNLFTLKHLLGGASFSTPKREHPSLLTTFVRHKHFAPNRFGEFEPYGPLTDETVTEAVHSVAKEDEQKTNPEILLSMVQFVRTRSPRCFYAMEWRINPHIAFSRPFAAIDQKFATNQTDTESWLAFILGMFSLLNPYYALFALEAETHTKNFAEWRESYPNAQDFRRNSWRAGGIGFQLAESGVPGVFWGNYFGPFYVDWFGRHKFDDIPCIEKRWLPTGGLFFTTCSSPFDWDTEEARSLQAAVKEHLGRDAFFDSDLVLSLLKRSRPLPPDTRPEDLQPPRRLPQFPFTIREMTYGTFEEEVAKARKYFDANGYIYIGMDGEALLYGDGSGGIVRITFGPGGKIEHIIP